MSPEHDAPSYVVTGDRGLFQPPRLDQFSEHAALGRYGDVLSLPLLRLAVAEEVVHVHAMALHECRHHVAPQVRPHRRPVHQDHRRPLAEHLVGHLASRCPLPLAEAPPTGLVFHLAPPLAPTGSRYLLNIISVTCYL